MYTPHRPLSVVIMMRILEEVKWHLRTWMKKHEASETIQPLVNNMEQKNRFLSFFLAFRDLISLLWLFAHICRWPHGVFDYNILSKWFHGIAHSMPFACGGANHISCKMSSSHNKATAACYIVISNTHTDNSNEDQYKSCKMNSFWRRK